jgi:DNA invertase Pin-like site-specific DNA recombinase
MKVQLVQKVAIYCRVSTTDQSCERQERDLLEYARMASYSVVGVWKETASGAKQNRSERHKVMNLAQSRCIEAILVTEMTRWGRSTLDLIQTLQELNSWGVSLIAQTGIQFDLTTPQGRLIANLMATLAEFERDLVRERVRSGLAAAKARGQKLGRQTGQRVKADRFGAKVLQMVEQGTSYRQIARELHLSKTTVNDIVKRHKASQPLPLELTMAKRKQATLKAVYQLKVSLKNLKPLIWRRIQVAETTNLNELHLIIQEVMGWENYHLHQFSIGGVNYGQPQQGYGIEVRNEKTVKLSDVVSGEKFKFNYTYDFGDDWEHSIVVEKILPFLCEVRYPICLAGKRACPPEDCGGTWGYIEFLEAIQDSSHPEHKNLLEWVGGDFDPSDCNLDEINQRLADCR